jgi:hypothetical protein
MEAKKAAASFEHLQARETALRAKEDEMQKMVRYRVTHARTLCCHHAFLLIVSSTTLEWLYALNTLLACRDMRTQRQRLM